jgi:hypothetical protein
LDFSSRPIVLDGPCPGRTSASGEAVAYRLAQGLAHPLLVAARQVHAPDGPGEEEVAGEHRLDAVRGHQVHDRARRVPGHGHDPHDERAQLERFAAMQLGDLVRHCWGHRAELRRDGSRRQANAGPGVVELPAVRGMQVGVDAIRAAHIGCGHRVVEVPVRDQHGARA